jgi:hypothetical protein
MGWMFIAALPAVWAATVAPAVAQTPQPGAAPSPERPAPAASARPKSPPQPEQKQGIDLFLGTWQFVWAGRETPINAGPRSGTATFTRIGSSEFMEIRIEGRSEAGSAFKEAAVAGWNAGQKTMAFHERFANGAEALSVGEWATPLAIHVDVQPIRVAGATWLVRRTYNITAAHSFDVVEELSVDGGPFQRLGKGEFTRKGGPPTP